MPVHCQVCDEVMTSNDYESDSCHGVHPFIHCSCWSKQYKEERIAKMKKDFGE